VYRSRTVDREREREREREAGGAGEEGAGSVFSHLPPVKPQEGGAKPTCQSTSLVAAGIISATNY